jgi:hypothetical protein
MARKICNIVLMFEFPFPIKQDGEEVDYQVDVDESLISPLAIICHFIKTD